MTITADKSGFYNFNEKAIKLNKLETIELSGLPQGEYQTIAVHPHMTLKHNKIVFLMDLNGIVRAHRVDFLSYKKQ